MGQLLSCLGTSDEDPVPVAQEGQGGGGGEAGVAEEAEGEPERPKSGWAPLSGHEEAVHRRLASWLALIRHNNLHSLKKKVSKDLAPHSTLTFAFSYKVADTWYDEIVHLFFVSGFAFSFNHEDLLGSRDYRLNFERAAIDPSLASSWVGDSCSWRWFELLFLENDQPNIIQRLCHFNGFLNKIFFGRSDGVNMPKLQRRLPETFDSLTVAIGKEVSSNVGKAYMNVVNKYAKGQSESNEPEVSTKFSANYKSEFVASKLFDAEILLFYYLLHLDGLSSFLASIPPNHTGGMSQFTLRVHSRYDTCVSCENVYLKQLDPLGVENFVQVIKQKTNMNCAVSVTVTSESFVDHALYHSRQDGAALFDCSDKPSYALKKSLVLPLPFYRRDGGFQQDDVLDYMWDTADDIKYVSNYLTICDCVGIERSITTSVHAVCWHCSWLKHDQIGFDDDSASYLAFRSVQFDN